MIIFQHYDYFTSHVNTIIMLFIYFHFFYMDYKLVGMLTFGLGHSTLASISWPSRALDLFYMILVSQNH